MNFAPKTKKLLAIGTAGLVVLAVAFVAGLTMLIRQAPAHLPTITAFANGKAVSVEPFLYCPVDAPLCESEGVTTVLPVSEHSVLQLSLPSEITSAPWIAAAVYAGEGSDIVETDTFYLPGAKLHLTVPPVDGDGRELLGVEIRLPSGIIDSDTQQEEIISHAIWSIATIEPIAIE
ncbi:DUF2771 domain-containing protein [Rhodococcus sp. BGS-1C]|uniref:DUF2771 family protein n=1 Tax=unclassified Rhodococcus (in: high G+C Gram-positive bacteria) TaxID=192944 RepID=UPI0019D03DFE|nr:DUF2771 family protein [Rhodococcus sp. KRD197]